MTISNPMRMMCGIVALLGGLAVPAATAWADPPTATSADVVVQHLQDEGYIIQFNMPTTMPLSQCTVSGISGVTMTMVPDGRVMAMLDPASHGTLYVTLNCPNSNN